MSKGKIISITKQGLQLFSEQYDYIKKQLEKQIKDCDYITRFKPIGGTFSIFYMKDGKEKYYNTTFEEFLKNEKIENKQWKRYTGHTKNTMIMTK